MDTTKRQAADRIRPILAAMERSIDSARRRRLHDEPDHPQPSSTPSQPRPAATQTSVHPDQPRTIDKRDELIAVTAANHKSPYSDERQPDEAPAPGKAKLKARPKRPVGYSTNGDRPFYGAKAG